MVMFFNLSLFMVLMATLFLKERLTCNVYKVLVWFSD
jgi:hypothetical protein